MLLFSVDSCHMCFIFVIFLKVFVCMFCAATLGGVMR